MNKMVKTMMSHKTVLDMACLLRNPAYLGKAVGQYTFFFHHHYIHGQRVRGKKFLSAENFLTNIYVLIYMNIIMNEYSKERLEQAARCLKVLAHPVRLVIIHLLGEGELSVQELEKAVGISQSSMSQHLSLLKDKEILESRRVAQQVLYRLRDPRLLQLTAITRELFCRMD
jgi:DNA-binding transcriptional ArsR family regulator